MRSALPPLQDSRGGARALAFIHSFIHSLIHPSIRQFVNPSIREEEKAGTFFRTLAKNGVDDERERKKKERKKERKKKLGTGGGVPHSFPRPVPCSPRYDYEHR